VPECDALVCAADDARPGLDRAGGRNASRTPQERDVPDAVELPDELDVETD
jgi:hypothetical protein